MTQKMLGLSKRAFSFRPWIGDWDWLMAESHRRDRSVSWLIREAIREKREREEA